MKTLPILLSLAAGAAAQEAAALDGAAAGNIRASKLTTPNKRDLAGAAASSKNAKTDSAKKPATKKKDDNKLHPLANRKTKEQRAKRDERSKHRETGDNFHRMLFNRDGSLKDSAPVKKEAGEETANENKNTKKRQKKEARRDLTPEQEEDRRLTREANQEPSKLPVKKNKSRRAVDKAMKRNKSRRAAAVENAKNEDAEDSVTKPSGAKGQELTDEERELKKTKSGKGGGGGGWGGGGWNDRWDDDDDGRLGDLLDRLGGGDRLDGLLDDDRKDDDRFDRNDDRFWDDDDKYGGGGGRGHRGGSGKSNKGGWDPSWGGKSGKGSGWDPSWDGWSGKSGKGSGGWGGKSSGWGSGKSGKGSWGGSGKSGKYGGDHHGGGGGHCGDHAHVTITNLSFEQSFSEIFIMTADWGVTERWPIYVFGNRTTPAMADLAQNADATLMENRYLNRWGVEQVKVFREFDFGLWSEPFLRGGTRARFKIRTSGLGHRLSVAAGLPFTNDGAVVLQGGAIYDGAEYWIPPIDMGAEGNIQTCWSVAAKEDDFPRNSECFEDKLSDENSNDIPGEGFVSMHRGLHDFDSNNDLKDLLFFWECDEIDDLDKSDDTTRFAYYFYEVGYDDDFLLCRNWGGGQCDPRDDENFLDFLDRADDYYFDRYTELAKQSTDFDDFCDLVTDANKAIDDAFKILEPWLFDWRNEVMHVEIDCGWHDDGWGHDGFGLGDLGFQGSDD